MSAVEHQGAETAVTKDEIVQKRQKGLSGGEQGSSGENH